MSLLLEESFTCEDESLITKNESVLNFGDGIEHVTSDVDSLITYDEDESDPLYHLNSDTEADAGEPFCNCIDFLDYNKNELLSSNNNVEASIEVNQDFVKYEIANINCYEETNTNEIRTTSAVVHYAGSCKEYGDIELEAVCESCIEDGTDQLNEVSTSIGNNYDIEKKFQPFAHPNHNVKAAAGIFYAESLVEDCDERVNETSISIKEHSHPEKWKQNIRKNLRQKG